MGGLWVDYNLMSTIPGLFVLGEANFSDHGANRLGASALMQGLADGYFVIPYTIGNYLAREKLAAVAETRTPRSAPPRRPSPRARSGCSRPAARAPPRRSTASSAEIMWEHCGMERDKKGLEHGMGKIPGLREEFWKQPARSRAAEPELNQSLEVAGRVADFLELGELMCLDALERDESCGCHFRTEHQMPDGEARRDDAEVLPRGGLGVHGRRQEADPQRRAADLRERGPRGAELQVMERKRVRSENSMRITLKVWRQKDAKSEGRFVTYEAPDVNEHMSFLEMLDVVNEALVVKGEEPIAFDHDCREGICGTCGFVINGKPHGPRPRTTVCQLHMRFFKDGDVLTIEPWRADAFPVVKDLVVDRSAFDRIIAAGGFISTAIGGAQDANSIPVRKEDADLAMDAAACIGCGACVAACPNAAAMLFTSAKVSHLALLPQGQPERPDRVRNMVARMDAEGFGTCTNHNECEAACPKGIRVEFIARMNADYVKASASAGRRAGGAPEAGG